MKTDFYLYRRSLLMNLFLAVNRRLQPETLFVPIRTFHDLQNTSIIWMKMPMCWYWLAEMLVNVCPPNVMVTNYLMYIVRCWDRPWWGKVVSLKIITNLVWKQTMLISLLPYRVSNRNLNEICRKWMSSLSVRMTNCQGCRKISFHSIWRNTHKWCRQHSAAPSLQGWKYSASEQSCWSISSNEEHACTAQERHWETRRICHYNAEIHRCRTCWRSAVKRTNS